MLNLVSGLNWLAVLVAFVVYSIIGMLWFTVLFVKPYRASLGRASEPPQKPAPIFIIGPTICALVITVAHALLMSALGIASYADAVSLALLVGIGYLVANTVNIAINPNMPRPLYYGAITGAYHLVGIMVVSLLIVAMR